MLHEPRDADGEDACNLYITTETEMEGERREEEKEQRMTSIHEQKH